MTRRACDEEDGETAPAGTEPAVFRGCERTQRAFDFSYGADFSHGHCQISVAAVDFDHSWNTFEFDFGAYRVFEKTLDKLGDRAAVISGTFGSAGLFGIFLMRQVKKTGYGNEKRNFECPQGGRSLRIWPGAVWKAAGFKDSSVEKNQAASGGRV